VRKPSEYIAAAVRNVQNRYMTDSTFIMTHVNESATVTRTASFRSGESTVTGDAPTEVYRVLAIAEDFPTIDRDDLVSLSSSQSSQPSTSSHLVTSIRSDLVRSSLTVGLSEALTKTTAQVIGSRGAQRISLSVGILVDFSGMSFDIPEGFSSSNVRRFRIVVANDDWSVSTPPQIGDSFKFDFKGELVSSAIDNVDRRGGYFIMSSRSSK